jgi:rRNA maturation RNase YbeY
MPSAPAPEQPIFFHSEHPDFHLSNQAEIANWIHDSAAKEQRKIQVLNFIFCTDTYLLDINVKYLNHNYLTDIITFPYSEGDHIESDIFISIDRVKDNAQSFETTFFDELCRVIIHGFLHLCGYRDKSNKEKQEMRAKEDYYLSLRSF